MNEDLKLISRTEDNTCDEVRLHNKETNDTDLEITTKNHEQTPEGFR